MIRILIFLTFCAVAHVAQATRPENPTDSAASATNQNVSQNVSTDPLASAAD